jgi:hypothetical protein
MGEGLCMQRQKLSQHLNRELSKSIQSNLIQQVLLQLALGIEIPRGQTGASQALLL